MTFTVADGGALSVADFGAVKSRAEVYDIGDEWRSSQTALARMCEACKPLAWHVNWLYFEARDDLEQALTDATMEMPRSQKRIDRLIDKLTAMPAEPEDGVEDWLISMPATHFKKSLVPSVKQWLSSEPGWIDEADYIDDHATARGAALAYWRDVDDDILELLGIEIVEGEHPGSTYWAAELTKTIVEANLAAEKAGMDIRFIRG